MRTGGFIIFSSEIWTPHSDDWLKLGTPPHNFYFVLFKLFYLFFDNFRRTWRKIRDKRHFTLWHLACHYYIEKLTQTFILLIGFTLFFTCALFESCPWPGFIFVPIFCELLVTLNIYFNSISIITIYSYHIQ